MKIYFAGSIRGGRDDVDFYMQIISKLAEYGEVLTEHVGDKNLSSYGQTEMTDEVIYTKDTNWIIEADVVVAEVTTASLGVGYEIGYAESLKKPVLAIYRQIEGKRISAMINGNKNIRVQPYAELNALDGILKDFFSQV